MSKPKWFVAVAILCVAQFVLTGPVLADEHEEEKDRTGVYFTWMLGHGDLDGVGSATDARRVGVNVRVRENLELAMEYISLPDAGNEGLRFGISPMYELDKGVTLLASVGYVVTDTPAGGIENDFLTYGVGFTYDLPWYFGIRGEYQRLDGQGDTYWLGPYWHLDGFKRTH